MCIASGLVGGEAFSLDASLIKANVDKKKRIPGEQPISLRSRRRHRERFASTWRPSIPPIVMRRMAVETSADRADLRRDVGVFLASAHSARVAGILPKETRRLSRPALAVDFVSKASRLRAYAGPF